MTQFRKAFGMSLVTCINAHRITHSKRMLSTTTEQVLTIAYESGFGSLSRFNDAFRRTVGCTPRQFRTFHQTTRSPVTLQNLPIEEIRTKPSGPLIGTG